MVSEEVVTLAHGSGGVETLRLVEELIAPRFKYKDYKGGIGLRELDDGATIPLNGFNLVISTDSYTVEPIFFPGGDIGKLAVTGSINDVVVMGAKPIVILDSIVVEEGFPLSYLRRILDSMAEVANREGVALVGGDFKVMPRGKVDRIIISTTCVGLVKRLITDAGLKVGDKLVISGTIAEHGAAILAAQMGMEVKGGLLSDCAPLTKLMEIALEVGGVTAAKDLTRGGLASALNEMARKSGVTVRIKEELIPIRNAVRRYSEMLGVDPLILASEGRALLGVEAKKAEELVRELRMRGFKDATVIGEVVGKGGKVLLETSVGGLRPLEPPSGEIVPRIC
ncbi:MAG: hydrogenase expression/formation protein HypE [Thermofilum sp. ex4484_15]|nr:MAG: hydrogenase expression/formation protein HypE [Thermofilum sp. ex4484_15]